MISVENFNSLLSNFKKFKECVIFVVAKPAYIEPNLEELLIKYRFEEVSKKYVVLGFDSNECRSVGRFFKVQPFQFKIFCFLPIHNNLFENEICWEGGGRDLGDWLKHLFFRVRDSLRQL